MCLYRVGKLERILLSSLLGSEYGGTFVRYSQYSTLALAQNRGLGIQPSCAASRVIEWVNVWGRSESIVPQEKVRQRGLKPPLIDFCLIYPDEVLQDSME